MQPFPLPTLDPTVLGEILNCLRAVIFVTSFLCRERVFLYLALVKVMTRPAQPHRWTQVSG